MKGLGEGTVGLHALKMSAFYASKKPPTPQGFKIFILFCLFLRKILLMQAQPVFYIFLSQCIFYHSESKFRRKMGKFNVQVKSFLAMELN